MAANASSESFDLTGRGLGALSHVEFPYLFADATYLKGRVGGQVASRVVVVVTGVTATGEREVLRCAVGDTETEVFWAEFFRSPALVKASVARCSRAHIAGYGD